MAIEATLFSTRSPEGKQLNLMIGDLLRQMGMRVSCNDAPTQSEFFNACISQDLVIVDASIEPNNQHNYAAFTAQPLVLDHVLVVSRTYLPQNFYGLREGGAPVYPHSRTNQEIYQWLKTELEDVLPSLPRSSWKKNMLVTGILSPFQDLKKEMGRQAGSYQVFISYRNHEIDVVKELAKKIEEGVFHHQVPQKVRLFMPGELVYKDEILSPLQRWQLLSNIEERIRSVKEMWIYESEKYYDSWWTCSEVVLLAYFQSVSSARPVLKVYKPGSAQHGQVLTEPSGLVPALSYEKRRSIDRLLSGSGRSRGAETAQRMRELSKIPVIGNSLFFGHPIFSLEWFQIRVFEEDQEKARSWKDNLNVDEFIQMSNLKLKYAPEEILEKVRRNGETTYDNYKITMGKPRFEWYATRMGQLNGPEYSNELTIATQPVFRATRMR